MAVKSILVECHTNWATEFYRLNFQMKYGMSVIQIQTSSDDECYVFKIPKGMGPVYNDFKQHYI